MRNTIERIIYNKMESKDFGESMCNETKLKVLRWIIQQLKQHGVMQAEGSDVSEGAAVASEGQGEANTCADCGRTKDEDGTCYSCEYGAMFGH